MNIDSCNRNYRSMLEKCIEEGNSSRRKQARTRLASFNYLTPYRDSMAGNTVTDGSANKVPEKSITDKTFLNSESSNRSSDNNNIDSNISSSSRSSGFTELYQGLRSHFFGILDWADNSIRESLKSKLPLATYAEVDNFGHFEEYLYSTECEGLVAWLTQEEISVLGWR
ncbi:hypothetical protein G6F36_008032 [Rhizopus arrhizus]|nr:hypothetical protein G6F36_008032 [Rhizopus arrhizus]